MVIQISALRPFPSILELTVCSVVFRIGFSGQNLATVTLISQDLIDTRSGPIDISKVGFSAQGVECFGDLPGGVSIEIHKEHKFYGGSFIGIDNQIPVQIVRVSQKLWRKCLDKRRI